MHMDIPVTVQHHLHGLGGRKPCVCSPLKCEGEPIPEPLQQFHGFLPQGNVSFNSYKLFCNQVSQSAIRAKTDYAEKYVLVWKVIRVYTVYTVKH